MAKFNLKKPALDSNDNPKLHCTRAYELFELCAFNRSVEKTKFLFESMSQHGFIPAYPIHVTRSQDGQLLIKAGHHRFHVANLLQLPVYYVVSDDDASIHDLERATNRWTQQDFLGSFKRCGKEDYAELADFQSRTGISLNLCISMFAGESAGSGNQQSKFKHGEFKIVDEGRAHAKAVAEVVELCSIYGINHAAGSIFVRALSRCLFTPEFSTGVFRQRVMSSSALFVKCHTVDEQMQQFESVYNRHLPANNRVPLVFVANQAMAARNATSQRKR